MSDVQWPRTDAMEKVKESHGVDPARNTNENWFARRQQLMLLDCFMHSQDEIAGGFHGGVSNQKWTHLRIERVFPQWE